MARAGVRSASAGPRAASQDRRGPARCRSDTLVGDCVVLDEEGRSRCRHPCMRNQPAKRRRMPDPAEGMMMMASTCGFVFTTTGRPCANHVADGVPWCRAGHPCSSTGVPRGARRPTPRTGPTRPRRARSGAAGPAPRESGTGAPPSCSGRRWPVRTPTSSASGPNTCSPTAGPRWRCSAALMPRRRPAPRWSSDSGGSARCWSSGTKNGGALEQSKPVERPARVGAIRDRGPAHREPGAGLRPPRRRELYELLCEIDDDEGFVGDEDGVDAHRWLHATYAVAARDGTPAAHRAYMRALDRVMRLVRPLVAS